MNRHSREASMYSMISLRNKKVMLQTFVLSGEDETPKRLTQINRRMKCVNIPRSEKRGHKHLHKCKERRTLMTSLS